MNVREKQQSESNRQRLGISREDWETLTKLSRTLRRWYEHECNGEIQRDEKTNLPYWHNMTTGERCRRALDKETMAVTRANKLAGDYDLKIYYQTDPRGCAIYLLKREDIQPGADLQSCYTDGTAVF